MIIDVITIFPGIFDGPFRESMIKRAVERSLVQINLVDLREYAADRHRQVDDTPYGGGPGMILKPEPLFTAVEKLKQKSAALSPRVILLSPQGRPFNQDLAAELAALEQIIMICGRYEGVDERVRTFLADEDISIGDYVLTGGELAAAVIIDAVVRLLPGFISVEAIANESFSQSLLEHPHYTRPALFREMAVPEVLLSGDHGRIAAWRRRQSIKRTLERRPELLDESKLGSEERVYLEELRNRLP